MGQCLTESMYHTQYVHTQYLSGYVGFVPIKSIQKIGIDVIRATDLKKHENIIPSTCTHLVTQLRTISVASVRVTLVWSAADTLP